MKLFIESQNSYLLDIVHKNPTTDLGLYMTPLKNGVVVGNCRSANRYDVVFLDTKYSYGTDDNQIDFMSFCHPDALLHSMNALFSHLLKERQTVLNTTIPWLSKTYEAVDQSPCTITVPLIWMDNGYYRKDSFLLSRYMPNIKLKPLKGCLYELVIEGVSTFEAVNLTLLVGFFLSLTNQQSDTYKGDEALIEKYVRILSNIKETPYFIHYLFIKRCCNYSPRLFSILQEPLQKALLEHQGLEVVFSPYDTQRSRIQFVKEHLDLSVPILDYGCGELMYFKALYKQVTNGYVAYDQEDFNAIAEGLKRNTGFEALHFTQDLKTIDTSLTYSIILSEVLEHNTTEVAQHFLKELKANFQFKQLILTTPNQTFNQFYQLEDGMRHEDHQIEYTELEFQTLIQDLFEDENYQLEFKAIGDQVNGISTTQGVIITPKV